MSKKLLEYDDFLYRLRDRWNFYINEEIFLCNTPNDKNIGYLIESKTIIPLVYVDFMIHLDSFIDNFTYIFTPDRSLLKHHPKIKWAPASFIWIEEPRIYPKTRLISMITSTKQFCLEHVKRIEMANKMINTGMVDVCGNGIRPIARKEEALCDYMFSIVMENAKYSGNFTEKILDCFATGTIPIYSGDPDIGKIFNMDGIIELTDDFHPSQVSADLYYEKMDVIKENLEIAMQFDHAQDWIYNNYLKELE